MSSTAGFRQPLSMSSWHAACAAGCCGVCHRVCCDAHHCQLFVCRGRAAGGGVCAICTRPTPSMHRPRHMFRPEQSGIVIMPVQLRGRRRPQGLGACPALSARVKGAQGSQGCGAPCMKPAAPKPVWETIGVSPSPWLANSRRSRGCRNSHSGRAEDGSAGQAAAVGETSRELSDNRSGLIKRSWGLPVSRVPAGCYDCSTLGAPPLPPMRRRAAGMRLPSRAQVVMLENAMRG